MIPAKFTPVDDILINTKLEIITAVKAGNPFRLRPRPVLKQGPRTQPFYRIRVSDSLIVSFERADRELIQKLVVDV